MIDHPHGQGNHPDVTAAGSPPGEPVRTVEPVAASDRPKEARGVFGVRDPQQSASHLTYLGLFTLQHRGQESAGIAVSDGTKILVMKLRTQTTSTGSPPVGAELADIEPTRSGPSSNGARSR